MCHFITGTLLAQDRSPAISAIAKSSSVALNPYQNHSLSQYLRPDEESFLTTTSHCDCGTALGIQRKIDASNLRRSVAHQKKRKSLEKRGWTNTKIQRWENQTQRDNLKSERSVEDRLNLYMPDASRWHEFIEDCIFKAEVSFCGLLLHWYRMSPETENIIIQKELDIDLQLLTRGSLLNIEEDVLYRFVKTSKCNTA